jgi:hypothetical protein
MNPKAFGVEPELLMNLEILPVSLKPADSFPLFLDKDIGLFVYLDRTVERRLEIGAVEAGSCKGINRSTEVVHYLV